MPTRSRDLGGSFTGEEDGHALVTIIVVAVAQPVGFGPSVMAHYKRGKSRAQSSPHTSGRTLEAFEKIPGFWWSRRWPRCHDIVFHSRPRRRFDRKVAGDITADRIDADAALWAIEKKPHKYYW